MLARAQGADHLLPFSLSSTPYIDRTTLGWAFFMKSENRFVCTKRAPGPSPISHQRARRLLYRTSEVCCSKTHHNPHHSPVPDTGCVCVCVAGRFTLKWRRRKSEIDPRHQPTMLRSVERRENSAKQGKANKQIFLSPSIFGKDESPGRPCVFVLF